MTRKHERYYGEAPHTFVLRFGMLFFEVLDGDRMILWFDSRAGCRSTLAAIRTGNPIPGAGCRKHG